MKKTISIVLAISSILLSSTMLFVSADEGAYDNLGATNNYTSNYDSTDESSYNGIDSSDIENKEEYILGDLDGNKKVDATDYLRIKKCFWGEHSIKGTEFAMADVDFDGKITTTDYLRMKNAFLNDEALDDSPWDNQKGKIEMHFNEKFAIDLEGRFEEAAYEIDDPSLKGMIAGGAMYSPYREGNPPEKKVITDHTGKEITIENPCTYADETGYLFHMYEGPEGTYTFNDNGEFTGCILYSGGVLIPGDETKKTEQELIEIGLKLIREMRPDKTYKIEYIEKFYEEYLVVYGRYLNNIKTTEYVSFFLTPYGAMTGWRFYDTGLDEYDSRSFNVNDDINVYSQKIIDTALALCQTDSFVKNNYITKDQVANMTVTLSEPSFGIGPTGKLVGYVWVNYESETGFKTSDFVGFYAQENIAVKAE